MESMMLPTVSGGFADLPDTTAAVLAADSQARIDAQVEAAMKPVRGVYRCPWKCGNPSYPAPKWRTEAGFRKHLATCPERPKPEDFTRAKPIAVETSDADWERRHAGQDWADSTEAQA